MTSNSFIIDVESTYRNRTEHPNPGQFNIPMSNSGRKQITNAVDPISLAAPVTQWTSNDFNATIGGTSPIITLIVTTDTAVGNGIGETNDGSYFTAVCAAPLLVQQRSNYYVGAVVKNTTLGELRRITKYTWIGVDGPGGDTRVMIYVNTPFSNAFAHGDGIEIVDPTDLSDITNPMFFVPGSFSGDNAYTGYKLHNETLNENRDIKYFDGTTRIITVKTSVNFNWLVTHNYSIRKEMPSVVHTVGVGNTTTTVVIAGGVAVNDAYNNMFIRISPAAGGLYETGGVSSVSPLGEMRKIISYVGGTSTATLSSPFGGVPTPGDFAELMVINHDNLNPLLYNGSSFLSSPQGYCCYEVELINATLPNKILDSGYGRRIAFYPYIFIELSSYFSSSGNIGSNNPHAKSALFKCIIKDVANPIVSSFVNIDAEKLKQIVSFQSNGDLRFAIRLPNGDIWKTMSSDTSSPFEPDPFVQISAQFKFTKH
jgi:hypothetical protein